MDNFEKDLKTLSFAPPPRWLKARTLVAVQNASEPLRRRKRLVNMLWMAIAAAMMLAMIGHYIASALAPIAGRQTPPPANVQRGELGDLTDLLPGGK